jgi:gamma-glutamyltranspeptidase/glutathione hydrolase
VTSHPPNASGVLALEILNILERFEAPPASAFGLAGWMDPRWLHLALEAAKQVYADREAHLADPASSPDTVSRLLDKAYAAGIAARIDPGRADPAPPPARTLVGGTVYLAAADGEGNVVSLVESNAKGFGSGVVDPATGVHFQNRGASFSLDPAHVNALAPGRRTAHTLLPGMLFRDGERRPWVVAGSMGGDIQPQVHAAFVSALVDGGADIAAMTAAPRVTVVPDGYLAPPLAVRAEDRFEPGVLDGLARLGHRIERGAPFDPGQGLGHAIELVDGGPAADGSYAAATDPRCAGLPATR